MCGVVIATLLMSSVCEAIVYGFLTDFVEPFPSLPGFRTGALMTHQVTGLTGQSVARSLFPSHSQIDSAHLEPRPSRKF